MVRESLDAFVRSDSAQARKVCTDDDFVDNLTHQLFRELLSFMIENPGTITRAIRLTFIGKYLERIADHATNWPSSSSTWWKERSFVIRRRRYFPTMKPEGIYSGRIPARSGKREKLKSGMQ